MMHQNHTTRNWPTGCHARASRGKHEHKGQVLRSQIAWGGPRGGADGCGKEGARHSAISKQATRELTKWQKRPTQPNDQAHAEEAHLFLVRLLRASWQASPRCAQRLHSQHAGQALVQGALRDARQLPPFIVPRSLWGT
eukprot:5049602-Alexandrium_andersonii.AAC.1